MCLKKIKLLEAYSKEYNKNLRINNVLNSSGELRILYRQGVKDADRTNSLAKDCNYKFINRRYFDRSYLEPGKVTIN